MRAQLDQDIEENKVTELTFKHTIYKRVYQSLFPVCYFRKGKSAYILAIIEEVILSPDFKRPGFVTNFDEFIGVKNGRQVFQTSNQEFYADFPKNARRSRFNRMLDKIENEEKAD